MTDLAEMTLQSLTPSPSVLVGDLVLHAPLYRPALLTGDLATVDIARGWRLEIGAWAVDTSSATSPATAYRSCLRGNASTY
jgi:hypothetical protein